MASLSAIRDAIKTTIDANITSLHGYDTVPAVANLPAYVVMPDPGETADFTVAMGRGLDTWRFMLYVLVSLRELDLAQDELDDYVTGAGASSIRQVIFNNRTLGLSGTDAHVARVSGYSGSFDAAQVEHVGAILHLVVHTPGTA